MSRTSQSIESAVAKDAARFKSLSLFFTFLLIVPIGAVVWFLATGRSDAEKLDTNVRTSVAEKTKTLQESIRQEVTKDIQGEISSVVDNKLGDVAKTVQAEVEKDVEDTVSRTIDAKLGNVKKDVHTVVMASLSRDLDRQISESVTKKGTPLYSLKYDVMENRKDLEKISNGSRPPGISELQAEIEKLSAKVAALEKELGKSSGARNNNK